MFNAYAYYLYWCSYGQAVNFFPLTHEWTKNDIVTIVWNYVNEFKEILDLGNSQTVKNFIYTVSLYGIHKLNSESGEPLYGRKFSEKKVNDWAVLISKHMDMAPRNAQECHLMGSFLEQSTKLWEISNPNEPFPAHFNFMASLQDNKNNNQIMDFYDELANQCGFAYSTPPFPKNSANSDNYENKFGSTSRKRTYAEVVGKQKNSSKQKNKSFLGISEPEPSQIVLENYNF